MDPESLFQAIVSLFFILLLLDLFFLGWFLVDEPILKLISEAGSSGNLVPIVL